MLRAAESKDQVRIVELAVITGMFTDEDRGIVDGMLQEYFAATSQLGHSCVVYERDGSVVGAAYMQPKTATDRVWDLTMIVVAPGEQRAGVGSALLTEMERILQGTGQRLLLVETSSTTEYSTARAFYRGNGYQQVAHIADYWAVGDDLIWFAKPLSANVSAVAAE